MEPKRVAVVTPVGDQCATAFAMSLVHMTKMTLLAQPEELEAFTVQAYASSILPYSRQLLAQYSIEQGATHILWIDSDMKFPEDTLLRFLKRTEPIVGINAMSRRAPFRCTAQSAPGTEFRTRSTDTGLEQVYRMGFGIMWTATEVFKKLGPAPWFEFEWVNQMDCFRGEDYVFFEKARRAGFDFWLDHDLSKEVRHMGSFGFSPLLTEMAEE